MVMLALAFVVVMLTFAFIVVMVAFVLLEAAGLNHHLNRITDIIGILPDKSAKRIGFEEFIVILIVRIFLEVQRDNGTDTILLGRLNGIAVKTLALPQPCFIGTIRTAQDGDLLRNHESGVEADAKLTDNVHILAHLLIIGMLLLECTGTALCNRTQVVFKLLLCHADTVIGDNERPALLIGLKPYLKLAAGQRGILRKALEITLIQCIARIRDKLTQENLSIRINGIYHQIQ